MTRIEAIRKLGKIEWDKYEGGMSRSDFEDLKHSLHDLLDLYDAVQKELFPENDIGGVHAWWPWGMNERVGRVRAVLSRLDAEVVER